MPDFYIRIDLSLEKVDNNLATYSRTVLSS